ncbi:hypothetical protein, partial [Acinetobacter baumannii]|uniref:hypothetical protein n=1 Tax=Acinetobacter baumannii TaxID=470 RepID=UPI001BC88F64
ITAQEASDDKFAVSVDGSYVQVLEEQKLKLGDTELESAYRPFQRWAFQGNRYQRDGDVSGRHQPLVESLQARL